MESAALEPSSTGFEFDDSLLGAHYSDRIRSVVRFLFENPGEHTMPEVAEAAFKSLGMLHLLKLC